jgi:peptide/nickel transport system permease protein
MRHTLRRILWVVPTLFIVSTLAFWILSQAARGPARAVPSGVAGAGLNTTVQLPLFFNSRPRNVRALAQQAVQGIARGDHQSTKHARQLVRLGGAALPHILPRLDSLRPAERTRVAQSLAPLGKRMHVGSPDELRDPQSAVLFWNRFWDDRSIDFRPAVVKRSVKRLARRSTPGRIQDIMQLDTYALPELIDAMGAVEDPQDVQRIARLSQLAAHITGLRWRVDPDAAVAEAADCSAQWKRWWRLHGSDFVVFDGTRHLSAMVVETAFGKWLGEATQGGLGVTLDGRPVLKVMGKRAPVTLWLVVAALAGGYAVGVAWAMLETTRQSAALRAVSAAVAVLVAALPVATLAALLAPDGLTPVPALGAPLLMVLATAALVCRYQHTGTRAALGRDYSVTMQALGASAWRQAVRCLKNSSAATASLLGVDLPALLTLAFVVEHAFGLAGLGEFSLHAVRSLDVAWLMALALTTALAVALAQIGSDLILTSLNPRAQPPLTEERTAGR